MLRYDSGAGSESVKAQVEDKIPKVLPIEKLIEFGIKS